MQRHRHVRPLNPTSSERHVRASCYRSHDDGATLDAASLQCSTDDSAIRRGGPMTRIRRLVVGAAIGFVLPALVGVSPAFVARHSTATPSTDLVDGQTVHIDGAGFNGSVAVGFCQAIDDGTPGQADCGGATPATTTTSSAGTFSGDVVVRRLIFVPSAGRTVNCAVESCAIGAGEIDGNGEVIPGTAAFAPIEFAARVARRSDSAPKRRTDHGGQRVRGRPREFPDEAPCGRAGREVVVRAPGGE